LQNKFTNKSNQWNLINILFANRSIISIQSDNHRLANFAASQCSSTTAEVQNAAGALGHAGTASAPVRKPVLKPNTGYTWNDNRVNSLVVALDEPSQGPVEHGTEVQQPRLQGVRRQNVRKVQVTYRERLILMHTRS